MLLLVTGASGVGKSTVRSLLAPQLAPEVECVELSHLSPKPRARDLVWRQRTAELAVQRAVQLQREGRHLLLCGDPVAAVEVAAAPSAPQLQGLAVSILDARSDAQADRLARRGDPTELLPNHLGFAEWMRAQATDPTHMLHVVTTNGWEQMRWERIAEIADDWHCVLLDTTCLEPAAVAAELKAWAQRVISGSAPLIGLATS